MKKLIGGAGLFAGVATLVVSAIAIATPNVSFTTTPLAVGNFGEIDVKTTEGKHKVKLKTKGDSDVHIVQNTVKPGGHSGWHTHPGPSLITVVSGTATLYDSDDPTCTPHAYAAGAGVIDPGGGHVHLLKNEGTVDLVTIAVQILPDGAPRRIDAPDPGNCPF